MHLSRAFPHVVSYTRFVALIPQMMVPMLAYLQSRLGACTGISFVDSTSLEVCDPKRISQHRVFAVDARRAVSSMGWFFGFKLHLAVTDRGERLSCCLTPGNVDDRTPVPADWSKDCAGSCLGIAVPFLLPLRNCSLNRDSNSSTCLRKNMKHHLMHLSDKPLVRKRANTLVHS